MTIPERIASLVAFAAVVTSVTGWLICRRPRKGGVVRRFRARLADRLDWWAIRVRPRTKLAPPQAGDVLMLYVSGPEGVTTHVQDGDGWIRVPSDGANP